MNTSKKTRRLVAAVVSATIALSLAACSSDSQSPATNTSAAAASGGDLVFAIAGGNLENGHMDPHSSQLDVSAYVGRNFLDSLVALDADGTVKPWLATDWTISEDGLTYTFNLREDVKFTDGTAFNAEAVVKNFEHIAAPETASTQALGMLGGELFAGAQATGEYQITVTLKGAYAPFLTNLATSFIGMYSPQVLANHTQDEIKAGGPEVSVGTGPFVLTKYTPQQELTFAPNKDYAWGPDIKSADGVSLADGTARLDSLTIRIVPEESARVGALQSDQAQVAVDLTPTGTAQLTGATISKVPSPGLPYSAFLNWSHGVFEDVKVRQAFEYAIDLDAAVNAAFGGEFERAWSVLSPSTPNSYDASIVNSWPVDQEKANQLLDDAGWTERDADGFRTKDGKRLSAEWLSWLPFPDERQALVNFMIDDLKKVGFELTHSAIEGPEYQARYADAEGNMILDFDITDWGFASLDADILRQHLHSQGYQNATTVKDLELDDLLATASSESDLAKRADVYSQIQKWNVEQVAIVPLYLPQFTAASLPSVTGLAYDSYGWPLFAGASVQK